MSRTRGHRFVLPMVGLARETDVFETSSPEDRRPPSLSVLAWPNGQPRYRHQCDFVPRKHNHRECLVGAIHKWLDRCPTNRRRGCTGSPGRREDSSDALTHAGPAKFLQVSERLTWNGRTFNVYPRGFHDGRVCWHRHAVGERDRVRWQPVSAGQVPGDRGRACECWPPQSKPRVAGAAHA